MWKTAFGCLVALLCSAAGHAAELTTTETRWLQGVWPVVAYARDRGLPLDIVVQPQPTPGAAPLAMAFVQGRCKLVFSMRGNSEAEATLDRIAPELFAGALELMAAHELGHCRRHLDGLWHALPPGHADLTDATPGGLGSALQAAMEEMQAARREEAYADLVGLAWAWRHHRQDYARLHAWLLAERQSDWTAGSHHDTLAWIARARPVPATLGLFDAATALWTAGLTGR